MVVTRVAISVTYFMMARTQMHQGKYVTIPDNKSIYGNGSLTNGYAMNNSITGTIFLCRPLGNCSITLLSGAFSLMVTVSLHCMFVVYVYH